jgi:uncharacterized protein
MSCPTRPLHVLRSLTIALAAALAEVSGEAASFDCKLAKTDAERTICASARLSALDERMGQEYARALRALSPAGAGALKKSQRSWLHFVAQVCASPEARGNGDTAERCLVRKFNGRLAELAQAGIRLGPYVFNRIDSYAARRSPDGDRYGSDSGFVTQHVGYPQIDSPRNAATNAWNAMQVQGLKVNRNDDEDEDTDHIVETTLGCVGADIISTETMSSQYTHGTPHGVYDRATGNQVLSPVLRDMTASDVFSADSGWEERMPTVFWEAYLRTHDAKENPPSVEEIIREAAPKPGAWLLTPAGLQISFSAYEAGCYACTPGPITVPWSAIKPMLATPDLATCKAPPAASR